MHTIQAVNMDLGDVADLKIGVQCLGNAEVNIAQIAGDQGDFEASSHVDQQVQLS